MNEIWKYVLRLKSVVAFLKIIITLVLSRPFATILNLARNHFSGQIPKNIRTIRRYNSMTSE